MHNAFYSKYSTDLARLVFVGIVLSEIMENTKVYISIFHILWSQNNTVNRIMYGYY